MQKYPRGSRGSPAKGVVWEDCSAGSNPAFCAKKEMDVCPSPFWRRRRARTRELSRVRARGGNGDGKLLTRKTRAPTLCCEATESRLLVPYFDVCPSPFWRRRRARTRELSRVRARGGNGDGKLLTRKTRAQTLCCEATESRLLRHKKSKGLIQKYCTFFLYIKVLFSYL